MNVVRRVARRVLQSAALNLNLMRMDPTSTARSAHETHISCQPWHFRMTWNTFFFVVAYLLLQMISEHI